MSLPELHYNFHDSLLCGYTLGPRSEVTLKIQLCNVFYQGGPLVLIRFSKIVNFSTVKAYFEPIEQPRNDRDPHASIDTLCYDSSKKSTSNDLHFFLELDLEGALRIHCGRVTIATIENTTEKLL